MGYKRKFTEEEKTHLRKAHKALWEEKRRAEKENRAPFTKYRELMKHGKA